MLVAITALMYDPAVSVELERVLAERVTDAIAVWPAAWLTAEELMRGLVERIPDAADLDQLRSLHAADVYLALACARGVREALDAFETTCGGDIDAAVRRRCGSVPWVNDFKQALREKLFVGVGERGPRIRDYSGRGTLRAWLRVVVVRDLTNQQTRGPRDEPADDRTPEPAAAPTDLALRLFKQQYAPQFAQALASSLAALETRERQLLKARFVDGVTLEELARQQAVDRATIVRRLAKARAGVLAAVRDQLARSTQLPTSEISSLIRHVRSGFEATLTQLLA